MLQPVEVSNFQHIGSRVNAFQKPGEGGGGFCLAGAGGQHHEAGGAVGVMVPAHIVSHIHLVGQGVGGVAQYQEVCLGGGMNQCGGAVVIFHADLPGDITGTGAGGNGGDLFHMAGLAGDALKADPCRNGLVHHCGHLRPGHGGVGGKGGGTGAAHIAGLKNTLDERAIGLVDGTGIGEPVELRGHTHGCRFQIDGAGQPHAHLLSAGRAAPGSAGGELLPQGIFQLGELRRSEFAHHIGLHLLIDTAFQGIGFCRSQLVDGVGFGSGENALLLGQGDHCLPGGIGVVGEVHSCHIHRCLGGPLFTECLVKSPGFQQNGEGISKGEGLVGRKPVVTGAPEEPQTGNFQNGRGAPVIVDVIELQLLSQLGGTGHAPVLRGRGERGVGRRRAQRSDEQGDDEDEGAHVSFHWLTPRI